MQVLLLEVYIQKPTFKVFLMTQNLDGKSWLSERLLLDINSMMDMFMSIISYKYKYQLKKSVKKILTYQLDPHYEGVDTLPYSIGNSCQLKSCRGTLS